VDPELAKLAQQHGPGFGDHGSRVAILSVATARFLGLNERQIDHLWFSSLIHDLGKTQLDPTILTKPTRLTHEETAAVQEHPQVGHDRIAHMVHPAVADAVLCHHERWDGSGYPHGVRGKSIPLFSRIIYVADAYDVMTTGRDYRPGLGIRDAGAELSTWSGRQFDPEIVNAFASIDRDLLSPRWDGTEHHHRHH